MTETILFDVHRGYAPYVAAIDFEILGAEEIERYSTVGVTATNIYSRNVPTPWGISDTRMGTCDRNVRCGTCANSITRCAGHCGHIHMPQPILHAAYSDHLLKLLRSICFLCGRCRTVIPPPDSEHNGKATFLATYTACKNKKKCMHCGAPCPQLVKTATGFKPTYSSNIEDEAVDSLLKQKLSPAVVREVLEIIPVDELSKLGIDPFTWDPEQLVMKHVLVPPPIVRPQRDKRMQKPRTRRSDT